MITDRQFPEPSGWCGRIVAPLHPNGIADKWARVSHCFKDEMGRPSALVATLEDGTHLSAAIETVTVIGRA